ncbi:hypothetical protein [Streptomyces alanosinicus]|uniref:ATP-grasp domain-containing protein n=1 Tax=Streptomyces alanosinicus TaxID=68171 RepID=A0A919D5U1_9ACTN|nr:hypothetical protein [Streptomyces alanosinicus]GHE12663.1 ATP-grasp domain-containing protein [Streptomyces alanosinicus]
MTTAAFLVIGDARTRAGELRRLQTHARELHDAELILCKEQLGHEDRGAVRHCVESDLEPSATTLASVLAFARRRGLNITGVLPHCDTGVALATMIADRLELPAADPVRATAAVCGSTYRRAEAELPARPAFLRAPAAREVRDEPEAQAFRDAVAPAEARLRPVVTGGGAGVRAGAAGTMRGALSRPAPRPGTTVIAEEFPAGARFYGVDHVAGFAWVTEQELLDGSGRLVRQQIVPAPLDAQAEARLLHTGFTAAEVCGFDGSVFHADVLRLPDGSTSVLAPALRPDRLGGWQLASLAFPDLDPWEQWLQYACEGTPAFGVFDQRAVAGIRRVRAPRDGVLSAAPYPRVSRLLDEHDPYLREVSFTKRLGDRVTRDITHEDDFLGHVICATPTYDQTRQTLLDCTRRIEDALEIS